MLEERSNITRNLPITVICSSTRHKIINQVIYEELFSAKYLRKDISNDWAKEASSRLKTFGIDINKTTLKNYVKEIKEGKRDPSAIANFGGQILDAEYYTSRYGKDGIWRINT